MDELLKKLSVIPIVSRGKIFETVLLNLHVEAENKAVVTSEEIEEFLRIAAKPYL